VHVRNDRKSAKYWTDPIVRLAHNSRFRRYELNEIEKIVVEHQDELIEAWNEFFQP
jgi:hypothetical protein